MRRDHAFRIFRPRTPFFLAIRCGMARSEYRTIVLTFIAFLFGLALGLWAGRKHALHPDYLPALFKRTIDKVQK